MPRKKLIWCEVTCGRCGAAASALIGALSMAEEELKGEGCNGKPQ